MQTTLDFSYVPVTGPIVSATPINPCKSGKTVGFAVAQIEVFHWAGSGIVREMVLPAHLMNAFKNRLKVSVTSATPLKVAKSHSAIKEPTQLYFLPGEKTVFGIHHDLAQLDNIILSKESIPTGSGEEGTSLKMTAHIGLFGETIEVPLTTFSPDIRGLIVRHKGELESCSTKTQLLAYIDALKRDIHMSESIQRKWANASPESLYQEYLERNRV